MFEDYLLQQGFKPRTIKEILNASTRLESWLIEENINQPAYNDLLAYISSLDYTVQTKNQTINQLKHYFRYQIKTNQRADNPALHIKIQGEHKRTYQTLTKEELDNLFEAYRTRKLTYPTRQLEAHKRYINILGLVIYQALSLQELNKLHTEDFNLHEGTITIHATSRSNERKIALNQRQILPLAIHLETRKGTFEKGRVNDAFKQLLMHLKDLGYRELTLQDIRASRISIWLREHNIRKVQYMTGFKYVSSLEKYRNQDVEGLRERVRKFHPLG